MRHLFLLLLLAIAPALRAEDEPIDPALEKEIRLMLRLTGAEELGLQAMKNMIQSFRQAMPGVPEEFWTGFEQEIEPGELTDLVVPVYARHLTMDELLAANRFYSTPEGRAIVAKLPLIMTESMNFGQIWGQAVAQKAIEKLKAKNLLPEDA